MPILIPSLQRLLPSLLEAQWMCIVKWFRNKFLKVSFCSYHWERLVHGDSTEFNKLSKTTKRGLMVLPLHSPCRWLLFAFIILSTFKTWLITIYVQVELIKVSFISKSKLVRPDTFYSFRHDIAFVFSFRQTFEKGRETVGIMYSFKTIALLFTFHLNFCVCFRLKKG